MSAVSQEAQVVRIRPLTSVYGARNVSIQADSRHFVAIEPRVPQRDDAAAPGSAAGHPLSQLGLSLHSMEPILSRARHRVADVRGRRAAAATTLTAEANVAHWAPIT